MLPVLRNFSYGEAGETSQDMNLSPFPGGGCGKKNVRLSSRCREMSLFVINCNCPRSLTTGRGRQESDRRESKVKIATWNVNGIRAREAQVLEWIGLDRPDVVCLQEIKAA